MPWLATSNPEAAVANTATETALLAGDRTAARLKQFLPLGRVAGSSLSLCVAPPSPSPSLLPSSLRCRETAILLSSDAERSCREDEGETDELEDLGCVVVAVCCSSLLVVVATAGTG